MDVSCKFYEDLMDHGVINDFGENLAFAGEFAIHLRTHYSVLIDGREIKRGKNDVDAIDEKVIAAGVELVHPLRPQPWRQKVIRFYDPDN